MEGTNREDYIDARPHSSGHLSEMHFSEAPNTFGSATALPPTDTGIQCWLFLFGSFLIETILWGFPFSFGVLQNYYSTHPPISDNPHGISAVGTTCSGILYLSAPLSFAALQRWPKFGRTSLFYGLPLLAIALAASSFASKVWHLLLTQGVLYAVAGGLLYYPIFNYMDEWFVRRKGFALGVMWAGSGSGGLTGPIVLQWGLNRYGPETFFRGWALAVIILLGPMLFFVRPRLPQSPNHRTPVRTMIAGFGFVKTPAFWAIQLGNVIQGLGYFIPALYLPTYARLNHTSSGSLLVSLINVASVPGVMILSSLSDRTSVYNLIFMTSIGSALSVFFLWGFSASSLPVLIVFALAYGFFAGGFTATYAGDARELRRVTPDGLNGRADTGSIFGLLSVGRGIGNIICGPLSEAILSRGSVWAGAEGAYGGMFGPLIVFTGITAALTMSSWVVKQVRIL